MPNDIAEITDDVHVNVSITDIGRSALRHAKEMRGLTQIVANIILWETESKDQPVPATIAKRGHHPLVRTLIEQARLYDHWNKLDEVANGDVRKEEDGEWIPVSALDQRIKIASGKSKALDSLRESCLRIQAGGSSAMKQAEDLAAKIQGMAQQMQMHREKLRADLDNATDAELLSITTDKP